MTVALGQCTSCWSPEDTILPTEDDLTDAPNPPEVTHLMRDDDVEPSLAHLLEAAEAGDLRTTVAMIDSGAVDLDGVEAVDRYSAMLTASEAGHVDVVAALVAAGASVETRDSYGRTPLYAAAVAGRLEVVTFLTNKAGADVGALDNERRTPFWACCAVRNMLVARVLFETGQCDINAVSTAGESALAFAEAHGHHEVAAFLALQGAARGPPGLVVERPS